MSYLLNSMTGLAELSIEGNALEWNNEMFFLLSKVTKIHLTFDKRKQISSIDTICDLPGLESINYFGPYDQDSINGMNCLFKAASALKFLSITRFAFNFIKQMAFPATVVSLDLSSDLISTINLKNILHALPALQCLTLDAQLIDWKAWDQDEELKALLASIKDVTLPRRDDSFAQSQRSIAQQTEAAKTAARHLSQSQQIDADTKLDPNKTYHVNRIFYGLRSTSKSAKQVMVKYRPIIKKNTTMDFTPLIL